MLIWIQDQMVDIFRDLQIIEEFAYYSGRFHGQQVVAEIQISNFILL